MLIEEVKRFLEYLMRATHIFSTRVVKKEGTKRNKYCYKSVKKAIIQKRRYTNTQSGTEGT